MADLPSSRITRAIIPAAGLGTRLLSVTKEQPKEMLPVFAPTRNGGTALKPVVQLIFEQLHECGIRQFCFVVGRGKRAIEDHFTPDWNFVKLLQSRDKQDQANDLLAFYEIVTRSGIFWVNQSDPRGFGDAVLTGKAVSDGNPVLVHAGDNHVISPNNDHIKRLLKAHHASGADATLLLRRVEDPRQYGVAEVTRRRGEIVVKRVVEKPERPATKLALLPTYIFQPVIFEALESIKPGKSGEMQLTDAVEELIRRGLKVRAVQLTKGEFWLDVGTPETYWQALNMSHDSLSGQ
jgi:UTP--glucose-1-phosphate uridylyltransferase